MPNTSPSAGAAGLMNFLPLLIVVVIFYFLIILPSQKKQKAHQQMLANLQKGDRVMTIAGIYGKVIAIKEQTVTLEIAENVQVDFVKSAINQVLNK